MALMRGRVFEKVGVNVSTVWGEFRPEFARQIPGAAEDPRFWASGVSLVAHPRSPHVPPAHLNTRHVQTTRAWFGGGADLNPIVPDEADTGAFHARLEQACATFDPECYARFKAWAEGGAPDDLPLIDKKTKPAKKPRDAFVYFIHEGKVRAPHAAMALMERVGK